MNEEGKWAHVYQSGDDESSYYGFARGPGFLDEVRMEILDYSLVAATPEQLAEYSPRGLLTDAEIRDAAEYAVFRAMLQNPRKIIAALERHSAEWNQSLLSLVRARIASILNPMIEAGFVSLGDSLPSEYNGRGWVEWAIAGADWLQSEHGKALIATAVAAGIGTEEEIRQKAIMRIASMQEPILPDYSMDMAAPVIEITKTSQADYYANLPGFVHPSQQEAPTSVFIRYSAMDESSLTLEIHVGLSYVQVDALSGERWLHNGASLSFRATDEHGHVKVRTLSNEGGVVSESEEVLPEYDPQPQQQEPEPEPDMDMGTATGTASGTATGTATGLDQGSGME